MAKQVLHSGGTAGCELTGARYDAAVKACKKPQPITGLTPAERQETIRELLALADAVSGDVCPVEDAAETFIVG